MAIIMQKSIQIGHGCRQFGVSAGEICRAGTPPALVCSMISRVTTAQLLCELPLPISTLSTKACIPRSRCLDSVADPCSKLPICSDSGSELSDIDVDPMTTVGLMI